MSRFYERLATQRPGGLSGNGLTGEYETRYTKEGKMVAKDRSAKKKNEMHCQRCNGPMAFEKYFGPNDSFFGWRCLMCGDILDPVILLHRLSQDAGVAIPEGEEEMMALMKKYTGSRSQERYAQGGQRRGKQHVNSARGVD